MISSDTNLDGKVIFRDFRLEAMYPSRSIKNLIQENKKEQLKITIWKYRIQTNF